MTYVFIRSVVQIEDAKRSQEVQSHFQRVLEIILILRNLHKYK